MPNLGTDAQIARAAAGNADAFASLVAEDGPDVHRLCMVITTDRLLAEEAVARACQQARSKLHTVRHREGFRAWILRVAANEAKQILRQNRRRSEVRLESVRDFEVQRMIHSATLACATRFVRWPHGIGSCSRTGTCSDSDRTRSAGRSASRARGLRTRLKRIRDRLNQELSDRD